MKKSNLELFEEYKVFTEITQVKRGSMRNTTAKLYNGDIAQYISFLGDKYVGDATYIEVDKFLDTIENRSGNEIAYMKTKNRKIVALRRFYNYLVDNKEIQSNPMDKTTMFEVPKSNQINRKDRKEKDYLEKREIMRFIELLKEDCKGEFKAGCGMSAQIIKANAFRNLAMFRLILNTGMRIGEVISLELDQIDIYEDRMSIYIPPEKSKNGRERDIPCSLDVLDDINAYIDLIPFESSYVFLSKNGKQLTPNGCNTDLKKYMNRLKINKDITCHSLRHSYATHMAEEISVFELAKRLGHDDIKVTLENYYHTSEDVAGKILNF